MYYYYYKINVLYPKLCNKGVCQKHPEGLSEQKLVTRVH